MALSETLARRGLFSELLRNSAEIPLAQRPELQNKGKGYLYVTAIHNPDDPTQSSALGVIPEALSVRNLGINSKDPSKTDFVIWNSSVADVQITRFSTASTSVDSSVRTREASLRSFGYSDFKVQEYPDKIVQVAIRRPVRPITSPAADTSLSVQEL